MAVYRIYTVRRGGKRILVPPAVITCADDKAAIQKSEDMVDGHDIELWDGARFVTRIKSRVTMRD
jgi:hypothetical protein